MADTAETKTKGAVKGGNGKFIFALMEMGKIEARSRPAPVIQRRWAR